MTIGIVLLILVLLVCPDLGALLLVLAVVGCIVVHH
jgi:hypothetical protein